MTAEEKDRIECAIRHIETAADVDPWAVEIAVKAMEKQIPKELIAEGDGYADGEMVYDSFYCPSCDHCMEEDEVEGYCPNCGQKICWEDGE
jgi:Zn finger protein HypA/HybF involved in hydrogenase expression